MRWTAVAMGLTVGFALAVPIASASHIIGWVARGDADLAGAHHFDASARFMPLGGDRGQFRLTLREPGVSDPVYSSEVTVLADNGPAAFVNEGGCAFIEVVPTVLDSAIPGVLHLEGATRENLCTGSLAGHFDGTHLGGALRLSLDVVFACGFHC